MWLLGNHRNFINSVCLFRYCQCQHTNPYSFYFCQARCTFHGRGSGGQHIIHNQYMFPRQGFGMM